MSIQEQYPYLYQFLGGYFHQDWQDDAAEWETIVQRFFSDASANDLQSTAEEIQLLLEKNLSAEELEYVLESLGCEFTPRVDLGDPNLHEWLNVLLTSCKEGIERHNKRSERRKGREE